MTNIKSPGLGFPLPNTNDGQIEQAPLAATAGPAFRPGGVQPAPEKPYTPPAGFPADPREFLTYLMAGQFTPEQEKYLRSNAFDIYVSAINSARGNGALTKEVALGDQIIAVWAAWRAAHPEPASNPFGNTVG